jgi:hypothetical protein
MIRQSGDLPIPLDLDGGDPVIRERTEAAARLVDREAGHVAVHGMR